MKNKLETKSVNDNETEDLVKITYLTFLIQKVQTQPNISSPLSLVETRLKKKYDE
jgi:hypothetical protein